MRTPSVPTHDGVTNPLLIKQANELIGQLKALSETDIKNIMKVSDTLAHQTHELISRWSDSPKDTIPAADSFLGDIYSGLRYRGLSNKAKKRADERLRILSGLYGVLRPQDGIYPYRLEMGYRLPTTSYRNLYKFWGSTIAKTLPTDQVVVNLAPQEYSKAVLPHLSKNIDVVSPKFLTHNQKTNKPTFVAIHTKIARGAFARWLLELDVQQTQKLEQFDQLGYIYSPSLSNKNQPVFTCQNFQGLGLSIK